jgi:hypothetical protein
VAGAFPALSFALVVAYSPSKAYVPRRLGARSSAQGLATKRLGILQVQWDYFIYGTDTHHFV